MWVIQLSPQANSSWDSPHLIQLLCVTPIVTNYNHQSPLVFSAAEAKIALIKQRLEDVHWRSQLCHVARAGRDARLG